MAEAVIETFVAGDGYRWQYRRYRGVRGQASGVRDQESVNPGSPFPMPNLSFLPRAHLVCLHGIQSHGGWYDFSCRRLAEAGFDVWFLDRRGSGLNEEARGDTPGYHRLLDDLIEFLRQRRLQSPAIPIFLLAISWGGKLAVALERYYRGFIDGIVLITPALFPKVSPRLIDEAAIAASALASPQKLFDIPLNDPELFTATPHWQKFLRHDPLALHQATARFLFQSFLLDRYARRAAWHVKIPVLLLLAGRDRIIDNAATLRFAARFATPDKTLIEYPEAHHTLEFEPDPTPYADQIQAWIERRL